MIFGNKEDEISLNLEGAEGCAVERGSGADAIVVEVVGSESSLTVGIWDTWGTGLKHELVSTSISGSFCFL